MAPSLEAVKERMRASADASDRSARIRSLDAEQREALSLFNEWAEITTSQIADLLNLSPCGTRAR